MEDKKTTTECKAYERFEQDLSDLYFTAIGAKEVERKKKDSNISTAR